MSVNPNEKKLESFNELIGPIEKEIIVISNMAAEISEKFQDLSRNIESLSGIVGVLAGRKYGAITSLAGGLLGIIGDIHAEDERQKALMRLLPKKQELANLKTSLIKGFRENLNNKIEYLSLLLKEEVNRPYDKSNHAEYVELYGGACLEAFELYTSTYYMVQVCDFMLEEFYAWSQNQHESGYESPDKSFVLNIVLNEIIFPNGLTNGLNTHGSNAGIWLLTERESIFAGSMYVKFKEGQIIQNENGEGFYSGSYKKKRVIKRESFKSLKKYVDEISKVVSNDKTGNLNFLHNTSIYKQAVDVCNIESPTRYFFKIAFLTCFFLFTIPLLISLISTGELTFQVILLPIIISFIFALIHSLVSRYWLWQKNVVSSGGGCFNSILELIFKLIIIVLSIGTVPLLVYLYEKKEEKFETFANNLRTDFQKPS
jgi:hypothetical protein